MESFIRFNMGPTPWFYLDWLRNYGGLKVTQVEVAVQNTIMFVSCFCSFFLLVPAFFLKENYVLRKNHKADIQRSPAITDPRIEAKLTISHFALVHQIRTVIYYLFEGSRLAQMFSPPHDHRCHVPTLLMIKLEKIEGSPRTVNLLLRIIHFDI